MPSGPRPDRLTRANDEAETSGQPALFVDAALAPPPAWASLPHWASYSFNSTCRGSVCPVAS